MQTAEERIIELEEQLKAKSGVSVKQGNKQNVCVYGLGQRFPVTLYAPGWMKLIENIDRVRDYIQVHHTELSWGNEPDPFEKVV